MRGSIRRLGPALLLLGWPLLTGSIAFAQTSQAVTAHHDRAVSLKGVITGLNATSMQLQTSTATVTVGLTPTTRVARVVSGTTTDLTSNARVELHLVNGTTVDAVRVDLVTRTAQPPHTSTGAHVHGTKPAGKVGHVHPARPNPTPRVPTRVAGQVVSVNGSSITIRTPRGTSTYTLAGNVSVVLIMNGTSSDLALGETVQSVVNSSNAALEITILKA